MPYPANNKISLPSIEELASGRRVIKAGGADAAMHSDASSSRLPAVGKLVIVGASTGGTEALREFLTPMPADGPAILVTQHMPVAFTQSFADRLNSLSRMTVTEAGHNERILPGHVYIAPGHSHMLVRRSGSSYFIELNQSEPVNHHRPSVEVLFRSAAQCVGANAIGVMLTGMGRDGAAAMLEMREAGAYNFTQDEASCVVYGMPRAAVEIGASHESVPVREMAQRVLARVMNGATKNRS